MPIGASLNTHLAQFYSAPDLFPMIFSATGSTTLIRQHIWVGYDKPQAIAIVVFDPKINLVGIKPWGLKGVEKRPHIQKLAHPMGMAPFWGVDAYLIGVSCQGLP